MTSLSVNSALKWLLIGTILVVNYALANSVVDQVINNNYEDVRSNLIDAIEEKALNISKIYHASAMLERTKDSVSNAKKIYHKAEVIEFCSAEISHQLVLANPSNIARCPFKITLYSLLDDIQETHVVFTKIQAIDKASEASSIKTNELIHSLVQSAAW